MPYQTQNKEGTADVLKKGAADYGSWMQITEAQANTIKGLEGLNIATSANPYAERFAQLVYTVNASSGGGDGSISDGVNPLILATVEDLTNSNPLATMLVDANGDQIVSFGGSGAISDGVDPLIQATVADLTASNPLASMIVDANGDQIVSFGTPSEAEGTPDAVANTKVMQGGGIAESGTPLAVADGDAVATWMTPLGQQVIAGYNLTVGALDVNMINQALISRLGPVINLNAVVATGAGSSIDVSNYHNFTVHITSASVTTGATVTIEHSLDGTNWVVISTDVIAANGTTETTITDQAYRYLRTNVISWTDGNYTTQIFAGN